MSAEPSKGGTPQAPDGPEGSPPPHSRRNANDEQYLRRFRHWLRDGRVHPLIHLMQQYRAEGEE